MNVKITLILLSFLAALFGFFSCEASAEDASFQAAPEPRERFGSVELERLATRAAVGKRAMTFPTPSRVPGCGSW
jgi:hypothetical protein